MVPAQTTSTYIPSVRGDAMLLTHGRQGAEEDLLLVSAAVVLDGLLGGHIGLSGRRLLGIDRRRVVAGDELPDAPSLMIELRERVLAGTPDTPWGWFDRTAVFAHSRVTAELDAAGVTMPLKLSRPRRLLRHDTLWVTAGAASAARERLLDALCGTGPPSAIALGSTLHACDLLREVAGRRDVRRLQAATRTLPPAVQTVLSILDEHRRRTARTGS